MEEVSIIGLDLAKNVFQAHGAAPDGSVVFRRKLSRGQVLKFFASQPNCTVAMEACAGAHHWARAIGALGHQVRLIAPGYVKPFVKRQKNDTADAEAIAEAALRPTMRFVAPKTEAQQARFTGEAAYSNNQCPAWSSSRIWCRRSGRLGPRRSLDRGDRRRKKRCATGTRGETGGHVGEADRDIE